MDRKNMKFQNEVHKTEMSALNYLDRQKPER